MPIIKNNKNIEKIILNNINISNVYQNSKIYFGTSESSQPTSTVLYLASNGDIMLKAGTYKAQVMDETTYETTVQDYQIAEDMRVRWSIPTISKNIEATLAAIEKHSVPAVAAELAIPAVGNFNVAAEPVAWSAANWGSREYWQNSTGGVPNTDFTINFSESQFYGGYRGTLESGNNTCTYKIRHLMSFKVPETASYQFNYRLQQGPLITSDDRSPISFRLCKKSDNSVLYTTSGTTGYRSYNDTMNASLPFKGDSLALTKDDELYADITIDRIVRYGGSNVSDNYRGNLNFEQSLRADYSPLNGSQQVTLGISIFGTDPADIQIVEYDAEKPDWFPNGLIGTINWTNGTVSSIT